MTKKKRGKVKLDKKRIRNKVISVINGHPSKSYNYKQLSKVLNINDSKGKELVNQLLYELEDKELIEQIKPGKFKLKSTTGMVTGVVEITNMGFALIRDTGLDKELRIPVKRLNRALDKDTVRAHVHYYKRAGYYEGDVVDVLERAPKTFVGILQVSHGHAFLKPDSRKVPFDLYISKDKLNGGQDGQKAIARLTDWPSKTKNPFGEIVDVLGQPGEHEVEMHAIMAEFELPIHFSKNVEVAANEIAEKIPASEIKKRRDFRDKTTFTIDPVTAKDFDDALSVERLPGNEWEIGVHIADVSHYVTPGSAVDNEAYNRGTSVYLVDRVIPMLPEKLSNKVCSLRPDEEKLCFSVVFKMDQNGAVLDTWYGKTIINSNRRFNYDEVQEIIEKKEGDFIEEILLLNKIAQKHRKSRIKKGSVDFERFEVSFEIDEKGKPLDITLFESNESHQLIEEFMLLANQKVAELFVSKKDGNADQEAAQNRNFVFRVHDKPNEDKIQNLNRILKQFGYKTNLKSDEVIPSLLNKILKETKGKQEQNIIETLILRSMAKAVYSTEDIGHYGLAFDHYTHFTSPIRRYPDLIVHRLLHNHLTGKKSKNKESLEKICEHSSAMEQLAVNAERASIKFKQVEYMRDKIGAQFPGVISGVMNMGLFVEVIENKCEGLVPIQDMEDDYYYYDDRNFCLQGRQTKKVYQLGDLVTVEVAAANLVKKQLDLRLVEE
jgi:ribonuclease R